MTAYERLPGLATASPPGPTTAVATGFDEATPPTPAIAKPTGLASAIAASSSGRLTVTESSIVLPVFDSSPTVSSSSLGFSFSSSFLSFFAVKPGNVFSGCFFAVDAPFGPFLTEIRS